MRIKPSTAFRYTQANRNARNTVTFPFCVVRVNKDGKPGKSVLARCATLEDANMKIADLERLNPGKKYVAY